MCYKLFKIKHKHVIVLHRRICCDYEEVVRIYLPDDVMDELFGFPESEPNINMDTYGGENEDDDDDDKHLNISNTLWTFTKV